jgi:hypothetical protein
MPTAVNQLGPGQTPIAMVRYPHMLDLDTIVWTAFLSGSHAMIDRVWYDVKVGVPIAIPAGSPPGLKAIAEGCGCLRIDAIALVAGSYWIVEVKPYGNHAALGQVILYLDLFGKRYGRSNPLIPTIVCSTADPNIRSTCESLKIKLIEVRSPLLTPGASLVPVPQEVGL